VKGGPGRFYVISRVHEVPRELRSWILGALALFPFLVAGFLRWRGVYEANGLGVALAIPILIAIAIAYVVHNRVEVGADAVSTHWLGRLQIVPLRDIARVESSNTNLDAGDPAWIRLVRHDGSAHTLLVGRDDEQRLLVVRKINAALLARSGLGAPHDAALARGTREPVDWVRALRGMSSGAEGGMRTAPFPGERLRTIVENVDADAVSRAAAAVALAPRATPEDRARIRVAAATTADPRLRIALERSIDEQAEEEALTEALAALDEKA
jgi:hypothetical protein